MTNANYSKLFEPGIIGKMSVKNRIVMAPMATNFAGASGEVNDRLVKYYAERARGGVGLVIVENSTIKHPEGKCVACQLRIDGDKYIPGYQELAEAVHLYGAKIFQQIVHAGRQVHDPEGVQAVAPSPIPCGFVQIPVRELNTDEIQDLIERFADAALRVKKAGMDGVEIHAAHGYLICEFLSPYTNKRSDEWGGSLEGRLKFLMEVIKHTRDKVGPDFPIGVRISADEFITGGLTLEETKEIASRAEVAGIDVLHVAAGIYESGPKMIEPMRYEEGWRVYLAEGIKKAVNIPVITVGQIKTPDFAEQVLNDRRADFVAIGRALIADPEWPCKAEEGRKKDIRKCISCNIGCIGGHVFSDLFMRCTVNPVVGREKKEGWPRLKVAEREKNVIVVGGGPGGMEAARVASLRGHRVTLYEKTNELGGQTIIAAVPPGKGKINSIREYYSHQLGGIGVKTVLGKEVDEALIRELRPEVLIIATGAESLLLQIPGISEEKVVRSWDVLAEKTKLQGKSVVVAGGGSEGCDTALYLAKQGKKVTIVEMLNELATDMEPFTRFDFLTEVLPKSGIQTMVKSTVKEISDKGIIVLDSSGKETELIADHVVAALGKKSLECLEEKVKEYVPEVYVIGDSKDPRRIINAIYEGASVARLI